VHARVSGRVQGVWYRGSAKVEAVRLGVTGWVRNLPGGDVELEAEGEGPAVERLLRWCRCGPAMARVDSVDVDSIDPIGGTGFEIRR